MKTIEEIKKELDRCSELWRKSRNNSSSNTLEMIVNTLEWVLENEKQEVVEGYDSHGNEIYNNPIEGE